MKTYLELQEVKLLEEQASNVRDRLLIRMLFHLGCRVSEALALAVEDIDFVRSTVTIQHLKARLKLSCIGCGQRLGRSHTFCPKCGGKVEKAQTEQQEHRRQRALPVDRETLRMLKEYIKRGGPV
ncbi:MAG: tyrosine-type recombinase/integrase, partial [Chloroflexota bacterium]